MSPKRHTLFLHYNKKTANNSLLLAAHTRQTITKDTDLTKKNDSENHKLRSITRMANLYIYWY